MRIISKFTFVLLCALACSGAPAERAPHGTQQDQAHGTNDHDEAEIPDVILLDSISLALAGVEIEAADSTFTTHLPVTGTITYDANRVSHIGSRAQGRILKLRADIGDRVRNGQSLAILESPEIGQVRAELHEAEAIERIARENYDREKQLNDQGISTRKELLAVEVELRRIEAARNSAAERLRVFGASDGIGAEFEITAPFAGVVIARDRSRGEMVTPADQIFTVADLSRVWIELDIFERDLSRVQRGQKVSVVTNAYPARVFPGTIVYLGAIVDSLKRTIQARVDIQNDDGVLKPGMFATARIQTGGRGQLSVVVPAVAVQEVGGRKVVFCPTNRRGEFRAVAVSVGPAVDGDRIIIASGLSVGDKIVTGGAFSLRSEFAKSEIGDHGH